MSDGFVRPQMTGRLHRVDRSMIGGALAALVLLTACPKKGGGPGPGAGPGPGPGTGPGPGLATIRPKLLTALRQLNVGACNGRTYQQEELQEPTRISAVDGQLSTELVVAFRERCVPVWDTVKNA